MLNTIKLSLILTFAICLLQKGLNGILILYSSFPVIRSHTRLFTVENTPSKLFTNFLILCYEKNN